MTKPKTPIEGLEKLAAIITHFPSKEQLDRMTTQTKNKHRQMLGRAARNFYTQYLTPATEASESNTQLTKIIIDLLSLSASPITLKSGHSIFNMGSNILTGLPTNTGFFWSSVFSTIQTNARTDLPWATYVFSQATREAPDRYQTHVFPLEKVRDLAEDLITKSIAAKDLNSVIFMLEAVPRLNKEFQVTAERIENIMVFASKIAEEAVSVDNISQILTPMHFAIDSLDDGDAKKRLAQNLANLTSKIDAKRPQPPGPAPVDRQKFLDKVVAGLKAPGGHGKT
jgi:hypothetical protein